MDNNGFPLVSIIVPIHNAEQYLDECITSVVSQTYPYCEIILVNDGSTDKSLEICLEWKDKDDRIVVIDKNNGGVSSARNAALAVAKGDFFLFLDADDFIGLSAVEELMSVCKRDNTEIAFCAFKIFNTQKSVISSAYTKSVISMNEAVEQCFQHQNTWFYASWAKLFSRSSIKDNECLMQFDESLLVGEDYKWLMQVLTANNDKIVSCINKPLYNYRRFSASASLSNFKGTNYLKRKDSLMQSDLYVASLIESKNLRNAYACSINKLASEYINGEVIIATLFGYSQLRKYRKKYQHVRDVISHCNGICLKVKAKVFLIHSILTIPIPKKVLKIGVNLKEKRREEDLYL